MNSSDLVMTGHYDYGLVALSILIAMLGSYATVELDRTSLLGVIAIQDESAALA